MKKHIALFSVLGLLGVGFAYADETAATPAEHHDGASEGLEHRLCEKHDEHCKADEAGTEAKEHTYCDDHKSHCAKHGKGHKHKKKT